MSETTEFKIGTTTVKKGLAQMLKGGVIVSVLSLEQFFIHSFVWSY